ncbi:hypothetical protein [Acidovorax sp. SUPP3334]|uniref:hypothetical protein n=1 Tax=Acidovorax sp. SUPP3334 TaxID=2920881 RepID=UPI0023DE31C6|nr:hypothetical protein [Acidovorax sp. SUPP3334]GKT22716.1 hypothetical protein AVHM3334_09315 [Acidovorax sp. SUPP3334]
MKHHTSSLSTHRSAFRQPRFWQTWPRWIWLLLAGMPLALLAGSLLSSRAFNTAELMHTDVCGGGDYSLEFYDYSDGAGYVKLVDRAGRSYGRAEHSDADALRPVWADDCLSVTVSTDRHRVRLEAKP